MDQVFHPSFFATAYPSTVTALDSAERVFLLAVRWWVTDYRQGEDPVPRLCRSMRIAGVHDAAFSVDQLMSVIARSVRRPITIQCPRCPNISRDETHLLHTASLVQAGEIELAERALRTALLSASGAEFALGPLEGLGELFTRASLFFGRRQKPAEDASSSDTAQLQLTVTRSIH